MYTPSQKSPYPCCGSDSSALARTTTVAGLEARFELLPEGRRCGWGSDLDCVEDDDIVFGKMSPEVGFRLDCELNMLKYGWKVDV